MAGQSKMDSGNCIVQWRIQEIIADSVELSQEIMTDAVVVAAEEE